MGRHAEKPWYRSGRDAWYAQIDGKQVMLAKGKKARREAMERLRELTAPGKAPVRTASLPIGEVCELYMRHAAANLAPTTAYFYRVKLKSFAAYCGGDLVSDATPKLVTGWLDSQKAWGPSTRSSGIAAVKRAFRWARREGHTKVDPFADIDKPGIRARDHMLSEAQVRAIRASVPPGDPFGDLLDFIAATGCRPSEAMNLEACHLRVEESAAVMPSKTTRRTGQLRRIHLSPAILPRLVELAALRPEGPLLRNERGNKWAPNALVQRFRNIRKRLGYGKEATAESYRHKFATDLLEAGVPIATAAELMGHRSVQMISRIYSKLRDRHDHLREALAKLDHVRRPHDSGPGSILGPESVAALRGGTDGDGSTGSATGTSHDS